MVEFSLLDKISSIAYFIYESPLFLILLLALILVILDITLISNKSKSTKIVYSIVSILVLAILLNNYLSEILSIFDVIAKNIVNIIFFPTVLEYIVMLLMSIGLIIYSYFSKKISKIIKIVSAICFISNLFIFFMILDEIANNSVDLTNIINIYSDDTLMILFETSLGFFIGWLSILLINKTIIFFIKRSEPVNLYEEPELPKTIEEIRDEQINFEPKIEYVVLEQENSDSLFTLDDYRKLRDILISIQKN